MYAYIGILMLLPVFMAFFYFMYKDIGIRGVLFVIMFMAGVTLGFGYLALALYLILRPA